MYMDIDRLHKNTRTAAASLALFALISHPSQPRAEAEFVSAGTAGFVVSHIEYALSHDADVTGACPDGMALNVEEIYKKHPKGQRQEGEAEQEYTERLQREPRQFVSGPNGEDLCMNPEAEGPDPHFRTVEGANIPVYGIDLDGDHSKRSDMPAPGRCPHDDFVGMAGQRGIDNQFYRAVGCIRSFQSGGQSNDFVTSMLTGAWGILIIVSGIDDIDNDDHVEIGFYTNADPVRVSPAQAPLEWATYSVEQNARYHASTHGRIVEGVLITEPVDMRLYRITNSILLERPLREARVQATLSAEGVLEGYLAGYTDVEDMYDLQFGFRNGQDGFKKTGELAPRALLSHSSHGSARVNGYTCHGVYHALYEHADGHPDSQGRCTSISTQYRFKAIPAFVVDVPDETPSTEAD